MPGSCHLKLLTISTYGRLQTLEDGCRMIAVGFASFFGLGLEDGHVATFGLLLQSCLRSSRNGERRVDLCLKLQLHMWETSAVP